MLAKNERDCRGLMGKKGEEKERRKRKRERERERRKKERKNKRTIEVFFMV